MLLHCEREGGAADDGASLAAGWLRAGALDSLIELNESCLALLAEQAAVHSGPASGLLPQLGELWHGLDGAARHRAATCPYLLLDAGFADPLRWQAPCAPQVGDTGTDPYTCYFTVPAAAGIARLVFIYAWHLARSHAAAARLLLGMPAASAVVIGNYTLQQIQALAESHPEWLRPRWPARVQVWRELLLAASSAESTALERARLRGLTLLAAEARLASAAAATRHGTSGAGAAATRGMPCGPFSPHGTAVPDAVQLAPQLRRARDAAP
ncbi:MAG TPA: hypothetical protein VGY90_07650 [Steroidobacteraceae bacterium]|jgi:hypothetical protein|nr:hypothetical protein [Steroidobacteraceae bacterium]